MQEVLVLMSERCAYQRLIWAGEEIAQSEGRPLKVIGVKPRRALRENPGAELEKLFVAARSAGAEMTVYYNDDPATVAVEHIRCHGAKRMVADVPSTIRESETIGRIRSECPDLAIDFVDDRGVLSGYPTMLELAKTACAHAW